MFLYLVQYFDAASLIGHLTTLVYCIRGGLCTNKQHLIPRFLITTSKVGKVQLRGGEKLVKQQYYNRNVKGQMLSILPYLHRLFTVKRRCCKIRSEVYVKAEKCTDELL